MDAVAGLDGLFEPLSRCLDDESARPNENNLSTSERSEYEALINAADFIAILKIKARRHLDQTPR